MKMKWLVVGLCFIVGKVSVSTNVIKLRTRQVSTTDYVSSTYPLQSGQLKKKLSLVRAFLGRQLRYEEKLPFEFSSKRPGDVNDPPEISTEIMKGNNTLQYKKEFPGQEWQYEGALPKAFPLEQARKSVITTTTTKALKKQDSKLQHKELADLKRQYEGLPIEFSVKTVPNTDEAEAAVTVKIQQSRGIPRRVFNPDETSSIEDYPFMAALLVNKELWCGAVIITRDKVLTAAHCLQLQYNNRFFREYVKMLSVRVGSSNATFGGDLLRVSEIMFHPNYRPQSLSFNLALLKLHKNMTFGKEQVRAEAVPFSRQRTVAVDTNVHFLGWGSGMSTGGVGGQVLLQRLTLPIYDLADCQHVYGKDLVTRNNFCAGYITIPKNVCNHDAGGPAIMDGLLIGILSFSSKVCDETDHPAVFSTVGAVADWLDELIL